MQSQLSFYDDLDELPDNLYIAVVTHPSGNLAQRCESLLYWRRSLFKGQLPRLFNWPANPEYQIIIEALDSSNKYQLCLNHPALCDYYCLQILQFIGSGKDRLVLLMPDDQSPEPPPQPSDNQAEPELEETPESTEPQSTKAKQKSETPLNIEPQSVAEKNLQGQLDKLFKDYAIERQLGFDLSQGIARRQQWKAVLKCHNTIKRSSWLQQIIRQLGRGREQRASEADSHPLYTEQHASVRHLSSHRSTRAPMEMRGIERNDDVGRMLPSELSMLGHKKLKMLWHLRRAERMLLSYEVDGVLSEHIPVREPLKTEDDAQGKHTHRQQGPLIIALDTSASMKGEPEHLAKAIVLEALRVCHQQKRLCYLFLFSGPDNIKSMLLDDSRQAWLNILDLMQYSFHGGTRIEQVMQQTVDLLLQKNWQQADIVLLSDGRFSVAESTQQALQNARRQYGLRCYGIHLGSWDKHAMSDLCDKVYDYSRLSREP